MTGPGSCRNCRPRPENRAEGAGSTPAPTASARGAAQAAPRPQSSHPGTPGTERGIPRTWGRNQREGLGKTARPTEDVRPPRREELRCPRGGSAQGLGKETRLRRESPQKTCRGPRLPRRLPTPRRPRQPCRDHARGVRQCCGHARGQTATAGGSASLAERSRRRPEADAARNPHTPVASLCAPVGLAGVDGNSARQRRPPALELRAARPALEAAGVCRAAVPSGAVYARARHHAVGTRPPRPRAQRAQPGDGQVH